MDIPNKPWTGQGNRNIRHQPSRGWRIDEQEETMTLPRNKTKLVCTIGPASDSSEMLEKMVNAGMNVARLNFSHGEFESHGEVVRRIRAVSRATGKSVAIMADMPGPKMRIGQLAEEPITLNTGDPFTLTTRDVVGNERLASVTFEGLPKAVKPGNILFLNDGLIQLGVVSVSGPDVFCTVQVGGELRSRKGLNLPNIDLGISAFTDRDRECLKFAIENGVDAISQSFVESKADITAVREAARECGRMPFIIAKIERTGALDRIDEIIEEADGIMVARGDLGVEIPIERIALVQKQLTAKANLRGKPVITATQMLESMTENRRPTRAEATDVANAILDGTDCVMLSEESAMGKYPVESVAMLASIAESIEPSRPGDCTRDALRSIVAGGRPSSGDLISIALESAMSEMSVAAVVVPSHGGTTARRLARLKLPVWVAAVVSEESVSRVLQFSYGVFAVCETMVIEDWSDYVRAWTAGQGLAGRSVILIEGPSVHNPDANHKMEIVDLEIRK
jgi:pyruvate kinase